MNHTRIWRSSPANNGNRYNIVVGHASAPPLDAWSSHLFVTTVDFQGTAMTESLGNGSVDFRDHAASFGRPYRPARILFSKGGRVGETVRLMRNDSQWNESLPIYRLPSPVVVPLIASKESAKPDWSVVQDPASVPLELVGCRTMDFHSSKRCLRRWG